MLIVLLLNALSLLPSVQSPAPAPGQTAGRVVCRLNPDQSYAVFLPSQYDPERRWPTLLALDPAARGTVPVETFQAAAEEYGFIVIGSNNSRNGPMAGAVAALDAMWKDAFDRFSLDPQRIYLTGFSGGARMAGHFALLSKQVRGVILCGAGFDLPAAGQRIPFSVLLTSGTWDSNFLEIKTLNADLLNRKVRTRLIMFDGGHRWPSPTISRQALQWLEVYACRDGIREKDESLINSVYQREWARARELEGEGRFFEAYLAYLDLKADFEELHDITDVEGRIFRLKGSIRLRSSLEKEQQIERVERRYIQEFLKEFFREKPKRRLEWWQGKLESIAGLEKRGAEYQLPIKRLREFIWRNGWERSWFAGEAGEYRRAAHLAEVATLVRLDAGRLHFHLSRMYALSDQPDKALDSLERAIETGFEDKESIRTEPAFASLKENTRFQKLLD